MRRWEGSTRSYVEKKIEIKQGALFFIKAVQVRVSLRAEELLNQLQAGEELNALLGNENCCLWRPEFAAYMIEGTPGAPYGGYLFSFLCDHVKLFG